MKILFIRHGQTKNNAEQKWLGSTDVSLWEEGINALLKNKSNIDKYKPFEKLYSSPMKRCIETAKIYFDDMNFEIMNDFFILANISPFYIGASYALTYLVNSNILTHKLAIVGFISFKFLQNRLSLDILASSGLHVKLPYYNSSTFIEAKASLVYKIL